MILALMVSLAGCRPQAVSPPSPPVVGANGAPTLCVGVPCGLAMVYKEARTLFLARHPGLTFVDRIEDSSKLLADARNTHKGLDVLITFGATELAVLQSEGRVAGTPAGFMRRGMELCLSKGNPLGIKSVSDLAAPRVRRVALCREDLTVGAAAVRAMETAGVYDKLKRSGRLLRLDQPLKLKQAVLSGQADAAFIYEAGATCSIENPERCVGDKAELLLVPEATYGGMETVAALLKDAPHQVLAEEFVQFLRGPEMQAAVARLGHSPVVPLDTKRPRGG